MAKKPEITWYPAANEKNVLGYFDAHYPILDIPASKAADEEKTRDILVLHTMVAGDPDRPAPIKVRASTGPTDPGNMMELIHRFPDAWKALQGEIVAMGGTPLDGLNVSDQKAMELSTFGVTRLEHLAALSDQQCENMGFGTRRLREEAHKLLADAAKPVTAEQRTVEVAAAVNSAMNSDQAKADFDKAVADAVAKAMAAMQPAEPAKRRGRPPKAQAASAESEAA